MTKEPRRSACARVFSSSEKRDLAGEVFHHVALDAVDFSFADLRGARFERVSLKACDFTGADLRTTAFHHCDLRGAILENVALEDNLFDGTCLAGVVGLSGAQRDLVRGGGGTFDDA